MTRARLSLRLPLTLHIPVTATVAFTLPWTSRPYSTKSTPTVTRYLVRQPSHAAPRECPTPLVFVRAQGLNPDGKDASEGNEEESVWNDWSGMFAEKGYTALQVDITLPPKSGGKSGSEENREGLGEGSVLKAMTSLLASQIRLLAIPFPPIIIASGASCLITQSYVEDHPGSGLVLVSPPPDEDPSPEKEMERGWKWPVFAYEGTFPILLLAGDGDSRVRRMAGEGVGRGGRGVRVEELRDGVGGEESRLAVERWMDRCGF